MPLPVEVEKKAQCKMPIKLKYMNKIVLVTFAKKLSFKDGISETELITEDEVKVIEERTQGEVDVANPIITFSGDEVRVSFKVFLRSAKRAVMGFGQR